MPSLADARSFNALFKPSYIPVAVFVGGTSGIGEGMVKALATYLGGNLHLIIVGRNRAAAEKTFASIPHPGNVLREFLSCDATLMRNVTATCAEIKHLLPAGKINFLVVSAGYTVASPRDETDEGLDKLLAIRYYSRFKFATELLEPLKIAADANEKAHYMTVLGTSKTKYSVDSSDFGIEKSYKWWKVMTSGTVYNDILVEKLSETEPSIVATHIHPGFVKTPAMEMLYSTSWIARLFRPLLNLIMWISGVSPEECAEYMLFALFDGQKGWYRRNDTGDDMGNTGYAISEEDKDALWKHSQNVTSPRNT